MSYKVTALKEHRYGSRRIAAGTDYEIESASELRTYKAVGFVKDTPPEHPPQPTQAKPAPAQRVRIEKVVAPPVEAPTPEPVAQGEPIGTVTEFKPSEPAADAETATAAKRAPYRRRDLTAEE